MKGNAGNRIMNMGGRLSLSSMKAAALSMMARAVKPHQVDASGVVSHQTGTSYHWPQRTSGSSQRRRRKRERQTRGGRS